MALGTLHLLLDTENNRVTFAPEGQATTSTHVFSRRWEAVCLDLLRQAASHGLVLHRDVLDGELKRRGQSQPLNRAQTIRLLASLGEFLDQLPGRPLRLEHAPRAASSGPWRLVNAGLVRIEALAPQPHAETPVAGVKLLAGEYSPDALLALLVDFLIADSFAVDGAFRSALETLEKIPEAVLASDGQALWLMRRAHCHNRLGHFIEARACTEAVCALEGQLLDTGMAAYARFWLDRIAYNQAPAANFQRLWQQVAFPRDGHGTDPGHLSEWHNLRALCARRMLHDAHARNEPVAQCRDYHRAAQAHYESAFYWALKLRDFERLQAFVINYAFHLQSAIPLGFSSVPETYRWHRLAHAYADKLDAGRDSSWEYIFLGKFWLDHEAELKTRADEALLALTVDAHPAHQAFYEESIRGVQRTGDPRQEALAWINYRRFAERHLSPSQQKPILAALRRLLSSQPELRENLVAEGYAPYLDKV